MGIPEYLKGVAMHPCCMSHCRDWRETLGGKIPASDHSPRCENFVQNKYQKLTVGGDWLVDTEEGIKTVVDEFEDDEEYTIEDIYMTQDQFERLPEFGGF